MTVGDLRDSWWKSWIQVNVLILLLMDDRRRQVESFETKALRKRPNPSSNG